MSLILDALRKSEAERRRGQSPDLFASTPLASTAAPRARGRWWPGAAGAALLLAGAAWWLSSAPETREPPPAADGARQAPLDTVPDSGESSPGWQRGKPDAPGAVGASSNRSVDAAPLNGTPPRGAPPMGAPSTGGSPVGSATGRPDPAAAPAPAGIDPATLPAAPANSLPSAASLPLPAASAITAYDTDAGDSVPPLSVLSPGERSSLPPLKLSMHVWASEPAKRFAIIDGQRVSEGSRAGNAVVAQIRRDGVVLDIGGRRVLLARP